MGNIFYTLICQLPIFSAKGIKIHLFFNFFLSEIPTGGICNILTPLKIGFAFF